MDDPPDEVQTNFGTFLGYKCITSKPQPIATFLFFSLYIIVTSWVVLSLFIGVMSVGMFEAFDAVETEMKEAAYRQRLEENQADADMGDKKTKRVISTSASATEGLTLKELIDYALLDEIVEYEAETQFQEIVFALQRVATAIQDSQLFQWLIIATILLVSVVIGIDANHEAKCAQQGSESCEPLDLVKVVDILSLAIFTFESAVKILAHGMDPKNYFTDKKDGSWNCLDFFVVCVGFIELTPAMILFESFPVVVLRLLRLLRVFRLAKGTRAALYSTINVTLGMIPVIRFCRFLYAPEALPRLRAIVDALLAGMSSVGWIVALIVVFN